MVSEDGYRTTETDQISASRRVGVPIAEGSREATTIESFIEPPGGVEVTGWERRPTVPLISRQLEEAALAGELPDDHPMYE